jgi:hypothetical protein
MVKRFMKKNKKEPSKYSKDKEEKSLGIWLSTQRTNKRGKGDNISQERIILLESLPNWKWNITSKGEPT